MTKPTDAHIEIIKVNQGERNITNYLLAVKEPLEITIGDDVKKNRNQRNILVIVLTPRHDFKLAIGFLFTEGIIENKNCIN